MTANNHFSCRMAT